MSLDNGSITQKIEIRKKGVALLGRHPELVLDLFAGEGFITDLYWRTIADKVICVEKIKGKCNINAGNVQVMEYSNRDKSIQALIPDADIIDLDAYQFVMPTIKNVLNICKKDSLIFFTDMVFGKQIGIFYNFFAGLPIKAFYYEKSEPMTKHNRPDNGVIYGYILA